MDDAEREWVTVPEAAEALSLTEAEVEDLATRRVLRCIEVAGDLLVELAAVTVHGPGGGSAAWSPH